MTECDCLKKIKEIAKWPFHRPIVINQETRNMECPGWAVRLFEETPGGRISNKEICDFFLNFCPICGQQLREIEERSE